MHRGVAQLVARLVRDQEARSSNLRTPTKNGRLLRKPAVFLFFIFSAFQPTIICVKHWRCGADRNGAGNRLFQIHASDCIRPEVRQEENHRDQQDDFTPGRKVFFTRGILSAPQIAAEQAAPLTPMPASACLPASGMRPMNMRCRLKSLYAVIITRAQRERKICASL